MKSGGHCHTRAHTHTGSCPIHLFLPGHSNSGFTATPEELAVGPHGSRPTVTGVALKHRHRTRVVFSPGDEAATARGIPSGARAAAARAARDGDADLDSGLASGGAAAVGKVFTDECTFGIAALASFREVPPLRKHTHRQAHARTNVHACSHARTFFDVFI